MVMRYGHIPTIRLLVTETIIAHFSFQS